MQFNTHRSIYRVFLFVILAAAWPVSADLADDVHGPAVLVLGDSLSAAFNIPLEQGWVNLLQQRVTKEYPGTRIINASVSGETAGNGVRRLPVLIERHSPDVIVIELGGNDGLRGFKLSSIKENLQTLIDISKAAGAEVVLAGIHLHPNYGHKFNQLFLDIYRQLAEENRIHRVPLILKGIGDDSGKMQADATHPTAAAQPEVLENMWPFIKEAIKAALEEPKKSKD